MKSDGLADRLADFSEILAGAYDALTNAKDASDPLSIDLSRPTALPALAASVVEAFEFGERVQSRWGDIGGWFTAAHLELCRINGQTTFPKVNSRVGSSLHDALVKNLTFTLVSFCDKSGSRVGAEIQLAAENKNTSRISELLVDNLDLVREACGVFIDIEDHLPALDFELAQASLLAFRYDGVGELRKVGRKSKPKLSVIAVNKVLDKFPTIRNEPLRERASQLAGEELTISQVRTIKSRRKKGNGTKQNRKT